MTFRAFGSEAGLHKEYLRCILGLSIAYLLKFVLDFLRPIPGNLILLRRAAGSTPTQMAVEHSSTRFAGTGSLPCVLLDPRSRPPSLTPPAPRSPGIISTFP